MSLSEFDIIDQIFNVEAETGKHVICGIGDDAALVQVPESHQLAVSTDTLVSGVHFFHDAKPFDIGFKSLAVNLSDMAAMGAEPLWMTLSLTIPDNNSDWITQFAAGFFQLAKRYGVSLIGGDTTQGPLSVTVQIMGIIPDNKALRRSSAQAGDHIYVTGQPGLAGLALAVLKGEIEIFTVPPADCLQRLHQPEPRIDVGLALRGIANAAIDISDGLAADLGHIIEMSSVGAEIELAALPVGGSLQQLSKEQAWSYALNSGDDYELCFTVPAQHERRLNQIRQTLSCELHCIGKITSGTGIFWISPEGKALVFPTGGYRHF